MLLRAAKARALLQGRDHALPDDVQALAGVVLAHRIVLAPEALDATRRADRRRRARRRRRRCSCRTGAMGAADAAPARPLGPAARPRRRAASARAPGCWTPSRSTSRASRSCCSRSAPSPGSCSARAACRCAAHGRRAARRWRTSRCAVEIVVRRAAAAAHRRACSTPLLPAPAPLATGRRDDARAHHVRFARRGARGARAAARRRARPVRAADADRAAAGAAPAELLVLPRIEPVLAPATASGERQRDRTARPAVDRRRGRARRPARAPRPGTPASRIFWPSLARGGDADGAPPARRQRHAPARRARPARRGARRGRGRGRARRRVAGPSTSPARGGCALLLPGDRRPVAARRRRCAGWAHAPRAPRAGRRRAAAVARRGLASRRGPDPLRRRRAG